MTPYVVVSLSGDDPIISIVLEENEMAAASSVRESDLEIDVSTCVGSIAEILAFIARYLTKAERKEFHHYLPATTKRRKKPRRHDRRPPSDTAMGQ